MGRGPGGFQGRATSGPPFRASGSGSQNPAWESLTSVGFKPSSEIRVGLFQVPIEIRPDIGTALAAGRAGELVFEIGHPRLIRPLVGVDAHRMRTTIIGAIDQQATNTGGAHFGEGDFLGRVIKRFKNPFRYIRIQQNDLRHPSSQRSARHHLATYKIGVQWMILCSSPRGSWCTPKNLCCPRRIFSRREMVTTPHRPSVTFFL